MEDENWKGFPVIFINEGLDTNGIFIKKEVRISTGKQTSLEEQRTFIEKYSGIINNLPLMKPASINMEKIPVKWGLRFFVRDSLSF